MTKSWIKWAKWSRVREKELVSPLIDGLAFLEKAITDMNQFHRNNLKHRLPEKLKPLADNVPRESQWLFGDDLSKRISKIISLLSLISRIMVGIRTTGVIVGTHIAVNRRSQKISIPPWGSQLKRERVRSWATTDFARTEKHGKISCWKSEAFLLKLEINHKWWNYSGHY